MDEPIEHHHGIPLVLYGKPFDFQIGNEREAMILATGRGDRNHTRAQEQMEMTEISETYRRSGAMAVDFRKTRFVSRTYSVPCSAGALRSTSFISALKASWARPVCDIRMDVSGGVMNWARWTSSKPTTES